MSDEVTYMMPGGPFGELIHRLIVRRRLEMIFDHRERAIAELFEGSQASTDRKGTT
jgi:hypothetical protein